MTQCLIVTSVTEIMQTEVAMATDSAGAGGKWEQDRQCTYCSNNNEARSRNHCYRGKAIGIKYYDCVCV